MADRHNGNESGQNTQNERGVVEAAEGILEGLNILWRRAASKIRKGHLILTFGALITTGSGAVGDHFIGSALAASNSTITVVDLGHPKMNMTDNVLSVGIISGATIKKVYQKGNEPGRVDHPRSDGTQEPDTLNLVDVSFPKPNHCDSDCNNAVKDLLGDGRSLSDCTSTCSVTFKDVDQGDPVPGGVAGKNDSSDIVRDCGGDKGDHQKVTILFDGHRSESGTEYPNILRVEPRCS